MSIITAQVTTKNYIKNKSFGILIDIGEVNTEITMEMFIPVINTKKIRDVVQILEKNLPSVFKSTCFNDYNYSFEKEVANTEIGHLFEHILLEYLCELKRDVGIEAPVHNGLTKWNWYEDKRGVFRISIDAGIKDEQVFEIALHKSIKLVAEILSAIPAGTVRKRAPKKIPLRPQMYLDLNDVR